MQYVKKLTLIISGISTCFLIIFYEHNKDLLQPHKMAAEISPNKLGNISNFKFTINHEKHCSDQQIHALLLIGSHPRHSSLRDVIRRTIANPQIPAKTIKLIFPFGQLQSEADQQNLEAENEKYEDIIQGNFIDSYKNVTLRDLMSFRFAWEFCPNAQFLVHIDDDTCVDIYRLMAAIERHESRLRTTIGCYNLLVNSTVFRQGLYGLSRDEYQYDLYPPYCEGWVYALTPHLARFLDRQAAGNDTKFLWLNDVFITGQLLEAMGQLPFDLNVSFTRDYEQLKESYGKWPPRYVVGYPRGDEKLIESFHVKFKEFDVVNRARLLV